MTAFCTNSLGEYMKKKYGQDSEKKKVHLNFWHPVKFSFTQEVTKKTGSFGQKHCGGLNYGSSERCMS